VGPVGRKTGRRFPPDIAESELESMARADENVVRAIGDAEVRKVIVRAPKLVNIVTA
jgi:leucyl-tRNA synthetase